MREAFKRPRIDGDEESALRRGPCEGMIMESGKWTSEWDIGKKIGAGKRLGKKAGCREMCCKEK